MIAPREVPAPDARELRACALAATAEAGVILLPVYLVLTESRGLEVSLSAIAVPFLVAYVGGALLACRFRASRNLATAAAVLAVLAGLWLGRGDLNRSVFSLVVALLIGARVVMLGLRDWRQPIHGEFGWLAVALGLETMIAGGAEPEWRGALAVIVPLFFVGMLASRAATLWSEADAGELEGAVRSAWIRRAALGAGALVATMAGTVALAVRGGAFDRIGAWLTPAAEAVVAFLALVMSQAARPIFWLIDRLGIDPERVRAFFDRLRQGGARHLLREQAEGGTWWQRGLALIVFVAVGYAIFRAIRRFRPEATGRAPTGRPAGTAVEAPLAEEAPLAPPRLLRRQPPADRVRRWYAQTLAVLRSRGVSKEPWQTPAEFEPTVVGAFPTVAREFEALTRAYEDVRYGSLRVDGAGLERLERDQERLRSALRDRSVGPAGTMQDS